MLRQLGRRISICVLASLIAVTCTDGPLIRDCAKELSFKSLDLCINELCTTGAIVSGVFLIDLEYRRSDAVSFRDVPFNTCFQIREFIRIDMNCTSGACILPSALREETLTVTSVEGDILFRFVDRDPTEE